MKRKSISKKLKDEVRKKYVRKLLFISDTHVGSKYALFPDNFCHDQGNLLGLNAGQRQLLGNWEDLRNKADELEVDTVFHGGDIIHGNNPKELGVGLLSTELDVQIEAARTLIGPLCKGRKSVFLPGTKYHVSTTGHNIEKDVADAMTPKGVWLENVSLLKIEPTSLIMHLSHGGGAGCVYRESAMAREILFAKVANSDDKLPRINIFVHGHQHWFSHIHQNNIHFVQLPCFTAYEPVGIFVKNYTRYQPDIGGVFMLISEKGEVEVVESLYPLPHIADPVKPI